MQKRLAVNWNALWLWGIGSVLVPAMPALSQQLPDPHFELLEGEAKRPIAYQDWVKRYGTMPPLMRVAGKQLTLRLVVTAIEGDEPEPVQNFPFHSSRKVSYGCQVSEDGTIGSFYFDSMGAKGGGYPQMSAADLKRLEELLQQLPDDGSKLAPYGRRLVLQVRDGAEVRVRVYDRANAPEPVLEILRLTGSGIKSFLPQFRPSTLWKAYAGDGGTLKLSPDGQHIISVSSSGPLQLWNTQTYALEKSVKRSFDSPIENFALNLSGTIAAIQGWGETSLLDTKTWEKSRSIAEPIANYDNKQITSLHFTPDGRFLMVQSNQTKMLLYNTKTWQRSEPPADWPPNLLSYFPNTDNPITANSRAVYGGLDGTVALWDVQGHRTLATIDQNARLHSVSYSPDGASVAVVTVHQGGGEYWSQYRITLWNAKNGALLHELRPFEQEKYDAVEGLVWSPDSRFLLAATKSNILTVNRGISLWSTKTGRHRGEFNGCISRVTGIMWLPDGRLIAGCEDGNVLVWDVTPALKTVSAFEASLEGG